MIAVIDYGVGNLYSLVCSLNHIGAEAVVTSDIEVIRSSDKIILPGVGAFADARAKLNDTGLIPTLNAEVKSGKPLLGICLGMQMLYERSYEYGCHEGLGYIKGEVVPFKLPAELKVPHMGWNSLNLLKPCPLTKYVTDGDYVYFVHSYYAAIGENTVASAEYGVGVTAITQNGNVFGTQFHPEKSGETGLNILRAFQEL